MRKIQALLPGLAASLLVWLYGCGIQTDQAVEIVQNTVFAEGQTCQSGVAKVAGPTGRVTWSSLHPQGMPSYTMAVNADIARGDKKARLQWVVNTETKFAELRAIIINGVPRPIYLGTVELELWTVDPPENKVASKVDNEPKMVSCTTREPGGECLIYKNTFADGHITYTNKLATDSRHWDDGHSSSE